MKVTIVGPGKVGMVLAYTLVLRGIAREVLLVGADQEKAEGEALDLTHAQAFQQVPVKVRAGGDRGRGWKQGGRDLRVGADAGRAHFTERFGARKRGADGNPAAATRGGRS